MPRRSVKQSQLNLLSTGLTSNAKTETKPKKPKTSYRNILSDGPIRLSATSLNLYRECPRCFWLEHSGQIHRPRGIFPSLPGGMDNVIKKYFDSYRSQGTLPPELIGKVEGQLVRDQALMERLRSWRTSPTYRDSKINATLIGALDECFIDGGLYIPVDYKTRGYPLKEGAREYYQDQLNCYTLLLESNGMKTKRIAYLIYYYPDNVKANGVVQFNVEPKKLTTDPEAARSLLIEVVKLLRQPQPPPHHSTCEFCSWGREAFEVA